MQESKTRWDATTGQAQEPGTTSESKIIPFRSRVKPIPAPAPAPMPEGFDRTISAKLDLITYLAESLQTEKRRLESFIPLEQAQ